MNRLKRAALLTELTDRLRQNGSWCGETHIQKATYLLQELLRVPTEFEFILYKFGPYSFDLGDELTAMLADQLVELQVRHPSYGPTFHTTNVGRELRSRYPVTLAKYKEHIAFVAKTVGDRGVADLERLATALLVTRKDTKNCSKSARAHRLTELKPHVSLESAEESIEELDSIILRANAEFPDSAMDRSTQIRTTA